MTIPDHDAYLLPPQCGIGPCVECYPHSMEDHEWPGGTSGYVCQVVGCECDDGREITRDDWEADEADREYSFRKEGL